LANAVVMRQGHHVSTGEHFQLWHTWSGRVNRHSTHISSGYGKVWATTSLCVLSLSAKMASSSLHHEKSFDALAHAQEKDTPSLESEQTSIDSSIPQWTEAEERQLVRKIDRLVMPLLMLAFFALQLDRGNMYV